MAEPAYDAEDPRPAESPFSLPPVTSGYPLEEREAAAIDRVLREGDEERGGDG